jgi:hypothetical protein
MKRIFLLAILIPVFIACNKEDEDVEQTVVKMGTIENPSQSTNFYFNQDDSTRVWVLNSEVKYYRPKNDQRVVMEYVKLTNKPRGSSYEHDVKLKDVYEILTKGIFNITPATQDSIGNDPVVISDMWVTGDFLNVEFVYPGYSKTHFINLVSDAIKNSTYTDNKVHLEFRHNANDDYPSYNISGIASFNLNSLRVAGVNSVEFVVHTKEFYGTTDKTYSFTYKYGTTPVAVAPAKQLAIPARKAVVR